jgi:signal transduction histidine kinase
MGNSFIAFLYLLCFLYIIFTMVLKSGTRNAFVGAIAFLFLIFTWMFSVHAIMAPAWKNLVMESVWLGISGIPALVFLCGRGQFSVISRIEAMASAEKFNQMKEEFLSVASHELRTPLSVITGFAEILVREKLGSLNDEQKRRVRKILMQGQRLNRIVDELLDLSRIRSGKVEVRREVFDVIPVLKACLDDHQVVCEQQKLKLLDKIPDVVPDVVGDLERVTQVVVNLLNNAIKYTGIGGTVTLTVVEDQAAGEVKIEVSDTGIGIDLKEQPRVFEEFYRSSDANARKFSGSGLGLAIVKQLVEAQKGRVGMSSEGLGRGSVFFFTLPIARKTATKNAEIFCAVPKTAH